MTVKSLDSQGCGSRYPWCGRSMLRDLKLGSKFKVSIIHPNTALCHGSEPGRGPLGSVRSSMNRSLSRGGLCRDTNLQTCPASLCWILVWRGTNFVSRRRLTSRVHQGAPWITLMHLFCIVSRS